MLLPARVFLVLLRIFGAEFAHMGESAPATMNLFGRNERED